MSEDFEIRTNADLAKLSRRLKELGDKELKTRLRKVLNGATKPMKESIKRNTDRLPQSGGLAARVRASTFSVNNKMSGRNIGVTLKAKSREGYNLRRLDFGQVRHLAWGREGEWYDQDVPGKFFEDGVMEHADDTHDAIVREASKISRELEQAP